MAAAKRYVFGTVGIDMIAGPSEILVICDGKTNPDWIAMDLFSQAEHDELAQAILLTDDAEFADKVAESIDRQIKGMSRKDIISASLNNRGAIIVTRSIEEACKVADTIAPEHLELSVQDADKYIDQIHHAGALFVGPLHLRSFRRLLCRPEPCSSDLPHRPLFFPARCLGLPETHERFEGQQTRRRKTRPYCRRACPRRIPDGPRCQRHVPRSRSGKEIRISS